jgi:hypothetical protein
VPGPTLSKVAILVLEQLSVVMSLRALFCHSLSSVSGKCVLILCGAGDSNVREVVEDISA